VLNSAKQTFEEQFDPEVWQNVLKHSALVFDTLSRWIKADLNNSMINGVLPENATSIELNGKAVTALSQFLQWYATTADVSSTSSNEYDDENSLIKSVALVRDSLSSFLKLFAASTASAHEVY
jgi:hypothetical protein